MSTLSQYPIAHGCRVFMPDGPATPPEGQSFVCARCHQTKPFFSDPAKTLFPEYGRTEAGELHCWACCGEVDQERMRETGRAVLYISFPGVGAVLQNWPGTLTIAPVRTHRRTVWSPVGGYIQRTDVWFTSEGQRWHGVNLGGSQITRCRRLKARR